jgi:acyl-homoserine-lactone acylase
MARGCSRSAAAERRKAATMRASSPIVLLAATLGASEAADPPAPSPQAMAASVTIYRDRSGVPHVYGPPDASVVFGFAYAQAEDFFWRAGSEPGRPPCC